MTLDQLIFTLENIRREIGTGNLQVLFRDPADSTLYDEIVPFATVVLDTDNPDLYSAFDLQLGDFYVEM